MWWQPKQTTISWTIQVILPHLADLCGWWASHRRLKIRPYSTSVFNNSNETAAAHVDILPHSLPRQGHFPIILPRATNTQAPRYSPSRVTWEAQSDGSKLRGPKCRPDRDHARQMLHIDTRGVTHDPAPSSPLTPVTSHYLPNTELVPRDCEQHFNTQERKATPFRKTQWVYSSIYVYRLLHPRKCHSFSSQHSYSISISTLNTFYFHFYSQHSGSILAYKCIVCYIQGSVIVFTLNRLIQNFWLIFIYLF